MDFVVIITIRMREISFWKALLCTAKPLVPDSLPLNNLLPPESLSTLRLSPKESSKHYFKKTKQVDKDSEVTLAVGDTKGSKHNFERRTKLVFGSDANALLC